MDAETLCDALSRPPAYPFRAGEIRVVQTHISIVALAGDFAFKVRKPVQLGFLDFTTLEKRKADCENEVRLNRRLAPDVYLGVVPIAAAPGGAAVEGSGETVEWAVKMRRLPDHARLLARIERGEPCEGVLRALAERLARFHAGAARSREIAAIGGLAVVAGNARENFDQAAPEVGKTVSDAVFRRVRIATEESLGRLGGTIDDRARRGVPCDGHGDLRLEHVYVFPDEPAPKDLLVIDCIEFNDRFRFADPVSDMAFLVMDLVFQGRKDLARVFADAYFEASRDDEGRGLLDFYVAYRSVVRAKVRGFELRDPAIPERRREESLAKARAHWLLALGTLEPPASRPALVLIGGLPGTGKSTLARDLADRGGFEVIRSDIVRKEILGLDPQKPAPAAFGSGIYDPAQTERTYEECLRRAEALVFEGRRVIVDANFPADAWRRRFVELGRRLAVPVIWFECRAAEDEVRRRLAARTGDPSDADFGIHERARAEYEPPSDATRAALSVVDTTPGREAALVAALDVLRARGLLGSA